jgi:hypothetical protein
MVDTYASTLDFAARVSPGYALPPEADLDRMLLKASELIDYVTFGRAQRAWDRAGAPGSGEDPAQVRVYLSQATCDQVEFWLEAGEEHDVLGLPKGSSLQGGRVQVQRIPGQLGQRAKRTLLTAGLMWAGVPYG